ncbi:MAG: ferritin-like domain-containing protein [Actinomycetota bacterium]|nr:ferritin-like domain-containing protein [Actinomycetota bacterium]
MSQAEQKVVQYLNEAHASELGLVQVLRAQIAMTPRGSYRSALEKHLGETQDHAGRIERRLTDLDHSGSPLQLAIGWAEAALAQGLAVAKTPLDMLRGSGGEEKVLKNAKDTCATEALEIATYTALEHLARAVRDRATAELAASIRSDEERMLARVMRELPKLTAAVVGADVHGDPSYDPSKTGAADGARKAGRQAKKTARRANTRVRSTTQQVRKVPGVARAEGEVKGAVASEQDLPIARYDSLTASDVVEKLSGLSQIDLAKIDAYERKNQDRSTVLGRISTLRGEEPWPGYDELNADEISALLSDADEERIKRVRTYERSHKNRAGVMSTAEREATSA